MTKCIHCKGEGRVTCPDCEGCGRKMLICPTCTKGYVPDPRSMDDEPTLLCPDCHGKWQLEDKGACNTCNGTGKVECDLCKGAGELDIEALCLPLIDVANESIRTAKMTREMVDVIKDAADNGNGMAAYVMGQLYYRQLKIDGKIIVPEDEDKMMKYLRIGAEAGNIFAQGCYGNEFRNGAGSSDHEDDDDAAGYPWILKAAENGDVLSLHRLSYDYLGGSSFLSVDLGKALACFRAIIAAKDNYAWNDEWIERARGYAEYLPEIINGNTEAMRQLGEWLKKRESGWKWSWGIGDAKDESSYWLKKSNAKKDYDNAVVGMASASSSDKKGKPSLPITKKRWKFVVLGLLFGFLGVHLAYAKRWFLFLLLWASLMVGGIASDKKAETVKPSDDTPAVQAENQPKGSGNMVENIGLGVWALLWIGGALFIKKDGKGSRM